MDPDLAQVAGLARGDRTGDAAPSPTLLHLLRSHFEYEDEFGWDGELFDGATCEMALMDIDDLEGTVNAVARVLRPDGVFVTAFVPPCFPGDEAWLSSWPPDHGYTCEGFWTSTDQTPDGVRIRVGSNHRTLSTYLNSFIAGGFR